MHKHAFAFLVANESTRPPGLVIDLGGRDVNGSPRDLFGEPYRAVDQWAGPGVDVVADAASYESTEPAACVICSETLEHAWDAPEIVANAYRLLQPGGVLLVTAAGTDRPPHSAVDGKALRAGEFYRGIAESDLRRWLVPFTTVTIRTDPGVFKVAHGDIYARAVK